MRTLILGASGHIGRSLLPKLNNSGFEPFVASRKVRDPTSPPALVVDVRNGDSIRSALQRVRPAFIVNAVAGDPATIADGARHVVDAAIAEGCPRIIHLSTMSVYGRFVGKATEETPFDPGLGWYAAAKCEAEVQMQRYVRAGGSVVILRPGCVYGPGSELWVGRVGRWLRSRRLGDLGVSGDGWSNLVHVDDVCRAIIWSLSVPVVDGKACAYNLAAPDSPRWNDYFIQLARLIDAVPVRRITRRQLIADSSLAGPPLKLVEISLRRLGMARDWLPDPLPPGLVRFFGQQIRLSGARIESTMPMRWTGYHQGLCSSAEWFSQAFANRSRGRHLAT